MKPQIDSEKAHDHALIRAVHLAAFPTPEEADVVDRLRTNGRSVISLVSRVDETVVGHVLFSPVTIHEVDGDQETARGRGLGLAPVAVLPKFQRRGIGSALIETGLTRCREIGVSFVVVLGDPAYYARFGFVPASLYRLDNEYGAGDAFQVHLTDQAALPDGGGLVRYVQEFSGLG
jgi:putative acetyltransferase